MSYELRNPAECTAALHAVAILATEIRLVAVRSQACSPPRPARPLSERLLDFVFKNWIDRELRWRRFEFDSIRDDCKRSEEGRSPGTYARPAQDGAQGP